jgi:response regulator NasT
MDSLRILIADDESLRVLSLKGQLESLGHKVIGEAANGKEALRLSEELKPDLAILDIKMPEMDGIEAAQKMMETRPIPIILLTAYSEKELAERAALANVSAPGNRACRATLPRISIVAPRGR